MRNKLFEEAIQHISKETTVKTQKFTDMIDDEVEKKIKITKKWREMADIYRKFVPNEPYYDFGLRSTEQMFLFESTGNPKLNLTDKIDGKYNGYLAGKHWMDATIKMWREDIDTGLLNRNELLTDFPGWFLTKIKI